MDAITMLTEQHTKLRTSFSAYEEAQTPAEKAAVFEDIADQLSVHTTIEEKLFYPVAYAGEAEHVLVDALGEHHGIKRQLVDLLGMTPGVEGFTDHLVALRERLEEHLREEESVLFPRVRARMTASDLRALWVKMEVLFTREAMDGPARKLERESVSAAW